MQAKIKRVIELGEGDSKKVYQIGTCELCADHCKGWFFDALVKDGTVELLEGTGRKVPNTPEAPIKVEAPKEEIEKPVKKTASKSTRKKKK